jgi:hypothetical protein
VGAPAEECSIVRDGRWRLTRTRTVNLGRRGSTLHDARAPAATLNFFVSPSSCTSRVPAATLPPAATMKISNSAVPVYTISGSEARPLPEWLIRRRKRCAVFTQDMQRPANDLLGV